MIGAIIGDIVGSRFEFNNTRDGNFALFSPECSFTDDTICTVAVADAILRGEDYRTSILRWCRKYPNPMGAYGASFALWLNSPDPQPYNSFGNGAAMRVSPVAYAFDTEQEVIRQAMETAKIDRGRELQTNRKPCASKFESHPYAPPVEAIRTSRHDSR